MKIFTFTLAFILLIIQNLAAYEGELRFFIDDNDNEAAYTIVANRLSTNDPLFGINFMEVDTDLYNNIVCTFGYRIPVTNDPPWDFYLGFDFVRDQGSYHFPFIGEGKYQISIFRDGLLVFRFKIDLTHHDSVPPYEGVDIDFYYRYSIGEFKVVDVITKTVAFDEMLYSWVLKNQDQDLTYFVNSIELTNFLATGPEPDIKTIFTSAEMDFPDPENFQTGEEYPPGTYAPLWRGVYYGLTVSHTTYTKNNIVYNFRNWFEPENFSSSTTFRILENTSRFRSDFYPIYPLTVSNHLEGGSSNDEFEITWQNPQITQMWQFGTAFKAFQYPYNLDQYSMTALTPMQSLGTTWHFRKWNDGSTNNTKTNLQITAPTTYTAYYKGIQRSDDENAYKSNSQRKFIRTDDNILHNVYSSMGRVFYETSSNGGVTWQLANNGQPLDNGEGKLPSIDYSTYYTGNETYYLVFIVFQEKYGSSSKIKVKYFQSIGGGAPYFSYEAGVGSVQGSYYSTNTTPVVGVHANYFTVVWKRTGDLYAWTGHINISGVITLDSEHSLTGTYSTSVNPTISFSKTFYSHQKLAWEEEDAAGSVIKYATLSGSQISGSITTPSNGSGFTDNYNPSIVQFMDASRLCWVGYRWISDPKKEEDGFPQTRVLFKAPESAEGRFWQFGNYVSGPSINRKTGDDTYYAFAWYESSGQSKFADNTLSTIRTISGVTGQNLQISNGPNKENMFCMSFDHNVEVPYFFEMSDDLGSFYTLEKITYFAFNSGREGNVSVDSAEFYFALGDLEIDGEPIDFKEIADTIPISDLSVLNEYLISEPFNVSDNSSFIYSVQYGINDSASAANAMIENRFINFKIKLIDDNTSEIIGEFDNVTYNSENIYQYNNISYQVNTQGIGNRTVRLKLVVDDNFSPNYSMSKIYSDESVLAKTNVKEINFNESALITSYDLFQNYPNPFNPSTIIRYQIPKSGNVSLKVYDILGSEIATLVNEFKNEGRYVVNFNASNLSSGVYIYRLNVNDPSTSSGQGYVNVKKMVLLK